MVFNDVWMNWIASFHLEMALFPMSWILRPIGRGY
jgi:hypothetical protein